MPHMWRKFANRKRSSSKLTKILAIIWFGSSPTPFPPLPWASSLSFSVFLCVAGRERQLAAGGGGTGAEEEPNHTMAKKPGPHSKLSVAHLEKETKISKLKRSSSQLYFYRIVRVKTYFLQLDQLFSAKKCLNMFSNISFHIINIFFTCMYLMSNEHFPFSSQILSPNWGIHYSRLWQRVVIPVRKAT